LLIGDSHFQVISESQK